MNRSVLPLNDGWRFTSDFREEYRAPGFDDGATLASRSAFSEVRVPHTSSLIPYDHFDERDYQGLCCYRRFLPAKTGPAGSRFILRFEGVMAYAEVFVDGRRVGEHKGGYTPFSFDVTEFLKTDGSALLCLMVDTRERSDIPPFGGSVDYLAYGGVYREVFLETLSATHVADLVIRARNVLSGVPVAELTATLSLPVPAQTRAVFSVRDRSGLNTAPLVAEGALMADRASFTVALPVPGARLWSVDSPALYDVEVELYVGDEIVDVVRDRFGFREAAFTPDGFFLNGERLKLRGLNRHQSFPYVGYAMPRRVQHRDAEILKYDLGCNIVRSSHYPPSRYFLDRCDEIGLLVFEELPGWRHIGDAAWKETALTNLGEMIRRDRNRPSVVLWGTRINESRDDDEFYARTQALAKSLDPTRQTGGVRDLKGSRLIEDVYTYNDFSYDGRGLALEKSRAVAKKRAPYLVSEHNGHMFPTKTFDPEERRVEHALRHLKVLDAAYGDSAVSGAIGWCLADYNTHREFGSGDRICRHGVLDMFRVPKYAAAAYASQREYPPFGLVASALSLGDRDGALLGSVCVLTNSDRVSVYKNDHLIGSFFPDRRTFPNLPHPPVIFDDLIGDSLADELSPRNAARLKSVFLARLRGKKPSPLQYARAARVMWEEKLTYSDLAALFTHHAAGWGSAAVVYRFEGFTGDRLDWTASKGGSAAARSLTIRADDGELCEDQTWDATRIEAALVDAAGNRLSYAVDPVELRVDGPLEIIGPACRSLNGGSTAFWVRTVGKDGLAAVSAHSGAFSSEDLQIRVRRQPHRSLTLY